MRIYYPAWRSRSRPTDRDRASIRIDASSSIRSHPISMSPSRGYSTPCADALWARRTGWAWPGRDWSCARSDPPPKKKGATVARTKRRMRCARTVCAYGVRARVRCARTPAFEISRGRGVARARGSVGGWASTTTTGTTTGVGARRSALGVDGARGRQKKKTLKSKCNARER